MVESTVRFSAKRHHDIEFHVMPLGSAPGTPRALFRVADFGSSYWGWNRFPTERRAFNLRLTTKVWVVCLIYLAEKTNATNHRIALFPRWPLFSYSRRVSGLEPDYGEYLDMVRRTMTSEWKASFWYTSSFVHVSLSPPKPLPHTYELQLVPLRQFTLFNHNPGSYAHIHFFAANPLGTCNRQASRYLGTWFPGYLCSRSSSPGLASNSTQQNPPQWNIWLRTRWVTTVPCSSSGGDGTYTTLQPHAVLLSLFQAFISGMQPVMSYAWK
jgi:hypothetical protein